MNHRSFVILLLSIVTLTVSQSVWGDPKPYSRKSLMKEVKASIKSGNYTKADQQLTEAENTYPEALTDAAIANTHMNVVHHLAEAENRRIFLANKPDTAAFLSQILRVYQIGLRCDSLDRQPDSRQRIRPRYTQDIQERFSFYRNNLFNAGKYFYKKKQYHEALRHIEMYITTESLPLVVEKDPASLRENYSLAVFAAYGDSSMTTVRHYLPYCYDDTLHKSLVCQIGSKAYMQTGDTLQAIRCLYDGWQADPTKDYFYLALAHYYTDHGQYLEALKVVDTQLQREPANTDLLYIKGMSMKCLQQYEEAITAYQHALRLRSDDARILSGIGEVYVIEAREMAEKNTAKVGTQAYIRSHQAQRKLYNQALPHLEKARTLDADNTTLWYNNLREVYYKLNKGKELKELEK